MTRVLLIVPTMYINKGQTDLASPTPPLGLGYMAASLEKAEHEIKILDVVGREGIIKRTIEEFKPEIIGIQCYTTNFIEFKKVVLDIRNYYKGLIIAGGPHITATGENTLPIDYFVQGEGEEVIVKLADGWRPRNKLIKAGPVNLKNIPILDRKFFEMNLYKHDSRFSIIATRGCPYHCIFCFESSTSHIVRYRKPEEIAEEMEKAEINYGAKQFIFNDDTTILNPDRIKELADIIEGKNYEISLNGRCNLMTDDLCKDLKRMGVKTCYFGVESGNQRILDIANKNQTVEQILNSMELMKKYNFHASTFMLMNLPTQTKEEIISDFKFAKMLIKKYNATVDYNILYCFPKTAVYEMLEKKITDWSIIRHEWAFPNVPLWEEEGKDIKEMMNLFKKIRNNINLIETPFKKRPEIITKYILRRLYRKGLRTIKPNKVFNSR